MALYILPHCIFCHSVYSVTVCSVSFVLLQEAGLLLQVLYLLLPRQPTGAPLSAANHVLHAEGMGLSAATYVALRGRSAGQGSGTT